jgi:hypothetical protein
VTRVRQKSRSSSLRGSPEAKRLAAAILEGLAGLRGPQDASEALGISMTRFYHLEARALQGLVDALEPRPRGRKQSSQSVVTRLEQEKAHLERELKRAQALVRSAQRTIGLRPVLQKGKLGADGKKPKRTRRTMVRAERAAAGLREAPPIDATSQGAGS